MRLYLFIYNDAVGTREEVKNAIDGMSDVASWRYDIPHCFYILSRVSAKRLYEQFVQARGTAGRFVFVEATENSEGQMTKDTWAFFERGEGE